MDFAWLTTLFTDYTLRTVALGSAILGVVSGTLGSYAVLRRQSLLGDAISHAALPGIALAFLLSGTKLPLVLLLGAALAGWLATLVILAIVRTTPIKEDTALGLVLSVFFGAGLVLLTYIQKLPIASQAGLDTFLFGQAATLVMRDVWTMGILGLLVLLLTLLLWKEFKVLSFDPDFTTTLGFPAQFLNVLLTSLLVVAIVLGLQTVGVVLMSAMVVAPASAARQWTDRLGVMMGLSALFGALAGICGAIASSLVPRLPTGPAIVVCISLMVAFSLLAAPHRGLLWRWLIQRRRRRRIVLQTVLLNLFQLARQHPGQEHGHAVAVLDAMMCGQVSSLPSLRVLAERGWARELEAGKWALTPEGLAEAEKLLHQQEQAS
ncbi:MAG: metal ABC transporter permease [Calditrichaeota bacterium]|nr:MAG: metal ABC transporter permease [Calditrichota bacterium]